MTEKELVEKILAECIRDGNITRGGENTGAGQRLDEDIFSWFTFGIRGDYREIVKLILSLIAENRKGPAPFVPKKDSYWQNEIIRYALFFDTMNRIGRGESVDTENLTVGFNPYTFSPDEILSLFRKAGSPNPMKDLIVGTVSFFRSGFSADDDGGMPEAERQRFSGWLSDFWPLLEKNRSEFVKSGDPDDNLECLQNSVETFIRDSSSSLFFDRFFAFLKDCWDMEGLNIAAAGDPFPSIVYTAFDTENAHAFSVSLPEAEKRGHDLMFCTYPVTSTDIFITMTEHGYLVPGTEEAKKVYYNYIVSHGNKANVEILRRANHPSYIVENGVSPLYAVMRNPEFPIERFVFVSLGQDDLDRVLREAYRRSYLSSIDALLSLGANPKRKYSGGDNMFHILLRDEGAALDSVLYLAPPECLVEKNGEGKTPLDYYFERKEQSGIST